MGPIETMVPGPGQKVNDNSIPAVGPKETMVPGLPGQKVNGNSTPAAGPIETMVPGFPGQTAGAQPFKDLRFQRPVEARNETIVHGGLTRWTP